jgi:NADPH:quinone reductase-like Zn-dependent oxidoreductase
MEFPTSYRRLVAAKAGDSVRAVATFKEEKTPEPADDEVLVRVIAAGINGGCETFRARGERAFAGLQGATDYSLGSEGAGIVIRAGKDTDFRPGDAVAFIGSAFAELNLVNQKMCLRFARAWPEKQAGAAGYGSVPAALDMESQVSFYREAAALRISGLTALVALELTGEIKKGQTILITAAAGGTGHFAVQIAKLNGARVVATCSTEEKAQMLRSLGADRVVVYTKEDLSSVLSAEFPDGLDLAYEGVGGQMHETALKHLKEGGRQLQVGYISDYPKAAGQSKTSTSAELGNKLGDAFWGPADGKTWKLPGDKTVYFNVWEGMDRSLSGITLERLYTLWQSGKLKALIDPQKFIGLEQAADAVEYMMSGKNTGKVILDVE